MRVNNPQKPHQRFLCHVRRLMPILPGRVTFRPGSRDRPYHEKTMARWWACDVDGVSLNRAARVPVVPPNHEHVLAFEPRVVPNSGTHTDGLAMFWNGAQSRAEKGLVLATLTGVEVSHQRA
jgi:hypothetical protein